MPYKYTFLQCGKKMLITLDGIKKATVNYIGGEVHLYTPSHSAAVSPAKPFILASPPISDMEDIDETDLLWGGDNKFVEAVKRLSDIHMDECIEENYWEMKRIRIAALTNKTSLGEDFINAQKWLDAAYEEKQARRENDLFLYLSINQ
jgi:hypothetical protein